MIGKWTDFFELIPLICDGMCVLVLKEEDKDMDVYYELYKHLQEGLNDVAFGRTAPFDMFVANLRNDMKDGALLYTL